MSKLSFILCCFIFGTLLTMGTIFSTLYVLFTYEVIDYEKFIKDAYLPPWLCLIFAVASYGIAVAMILDELDFEFARIRIVTHTVVHDYIEGLERKIMRKLEEIERKITH